MKILESHIVPPLRAKIRIQEYGAGIFRLIPSRSAVKKAIKKGEIFIDGKIASTSDWVTEGQNIELRQEPSGKKTYYLKLKVHFEDEYLAIIEKPGGIPTSGNYFRTIENALPFNLKPSSARDALCRPLPCHRLDNPTSGLLLIAKTADSLIRLNRAFEHNLVRKRYSAIVLGHTPEQGIINAEIEGKSAVTEFRKIKDLEVSGKALSLLTIFPRSGRTHQIRIHLSKEGFPILGDELYRGCSKVMGSGGLYLTATGLELEHPETFEKLCFEIPLPKKFRKLTERSGRTF